MRWMMVVLALVAAPVAAQEETERRLTVSGVGEVAAAPDMATVTLGVTERAKSAKSAMDAASASVSRMLTTLEEAGIEPRDVQTSELSLNPLWSDGEDNRPRVITGFVARNELSVRVRDLDLLGGVLDAVLEAGANRFRGLSFGLQDPEPVADEARRRAVADARRKAELYAEAAGITLGPVLTLDEGGGVRPEPMMMEMVRAAAPAPVPVAEGEVTTRARVNIVYALGN